MSSDASNGVPAVGVAADKPVAALFAVSEVVAQLDQKSISRAESSPA